MVDGREWFVLVCLADKDLAAGDLVQVKRMKWLAGFHQHEIGDVNNIVDRLPVGVERLKDGGQPLDEPVGTWPDRDISYDPCRVARA